MNDYKKFKFENVKRALANKELKIRTKLSQFVDYENLVKLIKKISKGDKGNDGDTPIKGIDYVDGQDAHTPIKGEDYFTQKEIDEFLKKITPEKGSDYKDGYNPVKGKDYFTEKEIGWFLKKVIPIKGKDYFTKKELDKIKKEITPVKGKDYKDGKTIQGKRGKQGRPGPEGKGIDEDKMLLEILERLEGKIDEDLTEQEKRVLEELGKKLGEMVQRSQSRGGGLGRQDILDIISGNQPHIVRDDLSSQCDGSNMVFNLSKVGIAGTYVLQGTQFPIIYRPGVDYNVAPDLKIVTLVAAEVGAPKLGQTLVCFYESEIK